MNKNELGLKSVTESLAIMASELMTLARRTMRTEAAFWDSESYYDTKDIEQQLHEALERVTEKAEAIKAEANEMKKIW
jgi:hypothetical protein